MEPYEDSRFETVVDENYHCPICMNVLKEPVMCQRNEHYFCSTCISKHLENSPTCPSCMEELTEGTLRQPPRIVTSYLFNLKIRCDYFRRGCRETVRLEDLKTHVENCGFLPVVCSNDGCSAEINKRDRIYHENEICDFRRVKCHDCAEVKECLEEIKEKLEMVEELKNLIIQMKDEMKKEIQVVHEPLPFHFKVRGDIIVAAGSGKNKNLKSVEMFSWLKRAWLPLPPLKHCCSGSSSVIYNNQIIISGGSFTDKMEKIDLHNDQESEEWSDFPASLPNKSSRQKCLVYQDRLLMVGGLQNDGEVKSTNGIWEVGLSPSYTGKLLSSMPQPRCYHAVECFNNNIFVFGGSTENNDIASIDSVIKYDITKNESKEMPPLPFAINSMASVTCGDHAVIVGGSKKDGEVLDTVIMYSFVTGLSKMLPPMKYKREGCTAVITGNVIVVMGGWNREQGYLKSVECFSFDRYSWEELPSMKEARRFATAVVKPNDFGLTDVS